MGNGGLAANRDAVLNWDAIASANCCGTYYSIALILRSAMWVNGILCKLRAIKLSDFATEQHIFSLQRPTMIRMTNEFLRKTFARLLLNPIT